MIERLSWRGGYLWTMIPVLLLAAGALAPALRAQEEEAEPPAVEKKAPAAESDATEDAGKAPEAAEETKKDDRRAAEIQRILDTTSPGTSTADEGGAAEAPAATGARKSDLAAIAVVEKYLKAIGGRENLAKIQDRSTKFRNLKYTATSVTEAVIALYIKRGDPLNHFREEWDIQDFKIGNRKLSFVQIYNGDLQEGWVKMFNTVSPLEGRTLSVFVWDKYIDDFFVHWESDGYTLHLVGTEKVDGQDTDIVKVVDFTGRQSLRYYFSRQTGLIVKKEWYDVVNRDRAKKEQYYKRYTPIAFSDGSGISIKFPLHLEILVDGDLDTERLYLGVKFNSGLSDELFAEPEGKPFEERDKIGDEDPAEGDPAAGTAAGDTGDAAAEEGE